MKSYYCIYIKTINNVYMAREEGKVNVLNSWQLTFLDNFAETFDFEGSARLVDKYPSQVRDVMQKSPMSTFAKKFREIQKGVIDNHRFNKCGSLERMYRWMQNAEEIGDYKLALDIQKEINKMIDGNIAIQKQITEHKKEVSVKVIDMTKPRQELPESDVEDADYEDYEDD